MISKNSSATKIALIATGLAFVVIVLGAYTRLTNSGLGCPDWPGCYGNLTAPSGDFEAHVEMLHRYVAGTLGLLIFYLSYKCFYCYRKLSIGITLLVIFQALLGMWTVTEKLLPIVVCAHLIGGLTILALLFLLTLKSLNFKPSSTSSTIAKPAKFLASISLIILIIQIMLGGWTSANYAALACPDFPTCYGMLLPELDFSNAFVINKFAATTQARITIHMLHRFGALITTILISTLLFKIYNKFRFISIVTALLLIIQIFLGITNVLAALPLSIAVLHNAVAALLLLAVVAINYLTISRHVR